ncbi:MAG TPA: DUF892 family protein [Gemmatimonadales bacterium]|nr:DUF892 family protein [Gemmatimonadales bacterium]
MAVNSLRDLYQNKLRMLCDVERQIIEVLPRLAERVANRDLRSGLEAHRRQTEDQLRQVEELCGKHGLRPEGRPAAGLKAELKDVEAKLKEIQDPDTVDAFVIAAAQGVEHFEIAAYGTARTWARQLGLQDDAETLQRILQQEEGTDRLLTDLAERMVNVAAARAGSEVAAGPGTRGPSQGPTA